MAEPFPIAITKDMWTDMGRLTEITKRANLVWELFPKDSYQINPYTKACCRYPTAYHNITILAFRNTQSFSLLKLKTSENVPFQWPMLLGKLDRNLLYVTTERSMDMTESGAFTTKRTLLQCKSAIKADL